jgi:WASH complex subunit FAM21
MKCLKQFSDTVMERTKNVEHEVEDLVTATNHLDISLHNTFNQFLMLSDTQFVENVSCALSCRKSESVLVACL